MGMGPGSKAAQPGAHGCAKSVRIVGSGVSTARIRKPGSGGRGGWGSYLDRGSNGVRFLSAWALFSSSGCGRGVRGSTCPLPVLSGAGSLPSLGLQWRRSSAPVTPQPRPRLLLPAQQLRPPRPFSPRTPPSPRLGSLRVRGPLQPAGVPNKSQFHQVPSAHAIPWVGGRGGGRFLLPARFPSPLPTAGACTQHSVVQFNPPNHLPSAPHLCSPGLPLPLKLLQCVLASTMPSFPSMTPRSQIQRSLAETLTATNERQMARGCQFPLCSPLLYISVAARHTGNICFLSHSLCSLYITARSSLGSGCQHPHFTDQEPEAQTHCMN